MKKLFKIAAVSVLTLMSVSAFAASQQAEELKKFQAWEEQNNSSFEAAFDSVISKAGVSDIATLEAAQAEFDKKVTEHLAGLDALNISSEEIKPLVAKYKEKVEADSNSVKAAVNVAKAPSLEAQRKLTEATAKVQEVGNALSTLEDQLEEKFPTDE